MKGVIDLKILNSQIERGMRHTKFDTGNVHFDFGLCAAALCAHGSDFLDWAKPFGYHPKANAPLSLLITLKNKTTETRQFSNQLFVRRELELCAHGSEFLG